MWIMGKSEMSRATRRRPPPKNARDRAVLVFAPLRRAQPVAPRTRRRESPVRHGRHPPCPTVYVNNLNEKIKKDGARRTPPRPIPLTLGIPPPVGTRAPFSNPGGSPRPRRAPCATTVPRPPPATYSPPTTLRPPSPRRAEEVLGRGLLPVRQGDRRGRRQDVQAPRPSVGCFRGRRVRHRRRPRPSGFPLLR